MVVLVTPPSYAWFARLCCWYCYYTAAVGGNGAAVGSAVGVMVWLF